LFFFKNKEEAKMCKVLLFALGRLLCWYSTKKYLVEDKTLYLSMTPKKDVMVFKKYLKKGKSVLPHARVESILKEVKLIDLGNGEMFLVQFSHAESVVEEPVDQESLGGVVAVFFITDTVPVLTKKKN